MVAEAVAVVAEAVAVAEVGVAAEETAGVAGVVAVEAVVAEVAGCSANGYATKPSFTLMCKAKPGSFSRLALRFLGASQDSAIGGNLPLRCILPAKPLSMNPTRLVRPIG